MKTKQLIATLAIATAAVVQVQMPVSVQATPVGSTVETVTGANIDIFNDGIFLTLTDAKNIMSATIEIDFLSDLEKPSTQFAGMYSVPTKTAKVSNGNKLTINVSDGKILSSSNKFGVAAITMPYNSIVSVSVYTTLQDGTSKSYSNFTTNFKEGDLPLSANPDSNTTPAPAPTPDVSHPTMPIMY
ncbi:hypothetical protein AN641_07895 [Candidatus Epulonipiscioides gigas]|nr:hypothetical protein AN641_07895 [Epulopiscium sp. SCG-C07WGA-EpuloA2]